MSQEISHASLTDRNLKDQHNIASISGLDTALAALAESDHASREYAFDAVTASHSSIHHASVAVAEAAYIESLLNRLETLSIDISGQQAQINSLVERVETGLSNINETLAYITQARSEAVSAASEAQGYAVTAERVNEAIESLQGILSDAITTSADISGARDRVVELAAAVETASSKAIQASFEAAHSSTEAEALLTSAREIMDAAETASSLASSAVAAARSIVNSVTQYTTMGQAAEESAAQAAAAAAQAVEAAATTQANAEIVQSIFEVVEGTMHIKGMVATAEELPDTAAEGDIMYSQGDYMYYLYAGDEWRIFSNARKWASADEELPEGNSVNMFRDGSVITLLTDELDENGNEVQTQTDVSGD